MPQRRRTVPTPDPTISDNGNGNSEKGNEMTETANVTETNETNSNEEKNVTVNPNGETPDNSDENSAGNSEEGKVIELNPGLINPDFYKGLYDGTVEKANEHNGLLALVKAAGDRVAITDQLKDKPEETNDPEFIAIAKRRQELSDALEAQEKKFADAAAPFIDAHLERSHVPENLEKADELAKQVKATVQFMAGMNATTDGIPNLVSRTGKTTTSGTGDGRGAGTKKYRDLTVIVDGKVAEQKYTKKNDDGTTTSEMRSNLTFGAQAANVTPTIFREAFTKAQGTEEAADFKPVVEFELTDPNGKTHKIVVRKDAS